MARYADRAYETTTVTGTGNATLLGAVAQHQAIYPDIPLNALFDYTIKGQTGTEWETGEGYLSNSTTLVRVQVYESSNAGALVNFSVGVKDVYVVAAAETLMDTGLSMALRMNVALR